MKLSRPSKSDVQQVSSLQHLSQQVQSSLREKASEGEGEGVKRPSVEKTRGEVESLPLPLACFARSLARRFFRARSCYSLSLPFRRLPRRLSPVKSKESTEKSDWTQILIN